MDPARYQAPEQFDPARFLPQNWDQGDKHVVFGHGDRRCPGRQMAESAMRLSMARLLWTFSFKCPLNRKGEEIRPDPSEIINGLPAHLKSFPALIKCRSDTTREVLGET